MVKSILKEIIIILLLLTAIILALGIFFYDYIPTNKTVPSVETYSTAQNIKVELDEPITEEEKVLVTYEITTDDLKTYEKKGNYEKGKANPFSPYVENTAGGSAGGNNNGIENSGNANNNTNSNPNKNSSNTFYKDTGTK